MEKERMILHPLLYYTKNVATLQITHPFLTRFAAFVG
jgi:hypothetical protein